MATKLATPRKAARKPRREELPESPNPVDIAMVAAVSGKPLPEVARRVLEEQADLIHAQRDELRLKHVGDIVRAALWGLLAIAAFAVLIAIGSVVVRAARADALIVESFKVPPAMAQQGLTGDVVATEVLDKIAAFQDDTQSIRAATSYDNNWGDDLKIDIPNTGATADQLWKLLRGWLGKETRISGEVIQTREGLALTARVGSSPGERFVAKDGNLDSLITKAAEHIMSQTQPYRYVWHLRDTGRQDQAIALLQQLTADPSLVERKWAWSGLAATYRFAGNFRASIAAADQAVSLDPKMIPARISRSYSEHILGIDQHAIDTLSAVFNAKNDGEYDQRILDANFCSALDTAGDITGDPQTFGQAIHCLETAPASYRTSLPFVQFELDAAKHDVPAMLALNQQPSSVYSPQETALNNAQARLQALTESGGEGLAEALQTFRSAQGVIAASSPYGRAIEATVIRPMEIRALLRLGRTDEAAALVNTTALDCYTCVRLRGSVAEARGNFPAAQRWFAEAVRQGPRLAQGYLDWGRLLLRAHRPDAALAKIERSAELSPNSPDPMKYWGDALAAQGKRDEALVKYDAALKIAPNWQELKQARARVAG